MCSRSSTLAERRLRSAVRRAIFRSNADARARNSASSEAASRRRKRRGNLVQRKPQIAQQADKMEISRLFGGITAITVAVHMDGAEQADVVVIDQHALFNGQHPGKFTGAEKYAESFLKKA